MDEIEEAPSSFGSMARDHENFGRSSRRREPSQQGNGRSRATSHPCGPVPNLSTNAPTTTTRKTNVNISNPRPWGTTVHCGPHEYWVGLYGWRRRCLYGLVLLLLVIVIVNLALTLFILRVLDFSTSGMGGLQIVKGGIVANGNVFVMDTLVAGRITSRPHAPIRILAADNITLAAFSSDGRLKSSMYMDENDLECISDHLVIRDNNGRVVFSATKDEVLIGAEHLTVTGEGGAVLSGSIQTGHVAAPVGESLMLESATRNLEVVAPQGIALESRAGSIKASCLDDFVLHSTAGVIKFDTQKIYVTGLPTSTIQRSDSSQVRPDVYQVCVCSGGKLFLASPRGVCAANQEFCK
ncbi:UNVERIFIED_CONTAM: hypothetical protein RMT77_005509 [Armadillidium vulgare]